MIHSTAAIIARHYRGIESGEWFRFACPVHHGTKRSLAIRDGDSGGIMAVCHSHGCAYGDILSAFRDAGVLPPQHWTYADGRQVTRTDYRGGGKSITQTRNADAGGSSGSPVMISGPAAGVVVLVEGERAFDATLSAGLRAACCRGGSAQVGRASFAGLRGETVLIWPDHDSQGIKAAQVAAQQLYSAGAASIAILPPVGEPGSGADAADITNAAVQEHVATGGHAWAPPAPSVYPAKDAIALVGALRGFHIQLRLNVRAARVEIRDNGADHWRHLDDQWEAYLRGEISRTYKVRTSRGESPLHFGRDAWGDLVNELCHTRRVDPFAEWLATLPAWDGDQRLESMLTDVFDAPPDDLSRWASRTSLVGAIVRARRPGAPLDEIPVLLGPQGIGKSKLWPPLFPEEHRELWFSDELDFGGRRKEQIESTLGRVIVEAGELAGLAGSDMERLKTYLSRTNDGAIRLAYGHRPEPILRRFVVIGTTNDHNCLPNDPSGNRRFVPIKCPCNALNGPVEAWAEASREQLWAEALHLADEGDDGRLPIGLHRSRDARNARHRSANETVETAVAQIDALAFPDGGTMLALIESLDEAGFARRTLERAHSREVARSLRFAGWRQHVGRTPKGPVQRLWLPPA